MATSANPFDVGGTNSTGAAPYTPNTAQQFNAVTSTVDPTKETVAGQLNTIMQQDSPLMQQARAQATQNMAARGLINSSMNQGAGVAAMLDKATPIATADANIYSGRAITNVNNQNTVGMANISQANQFGLQGNEQAFTASQTAATQNFTAAQAQLDRAQQTALADKSIEAQQALVKAQQNFDAAQNALNREQQTTLQTSQQAFTAGQNALDRNQQTSLATAAQTFQATQSEKDRATQIMLADKNITAQQALEQSRQEATAALQAGQQTFTAAQTALERGQQITLLQAQQNHAAAQAALDRAQQLSIADKSIEAQANLQKAQQDFNASQSVLDRAQQTALQTGAQTFAAGQNAIQNDFAARQAELQRQGQSEMQAKDIASREAMTKLEQAGITNRFDQELALKSNEFSIEQANIDARQTKANEAKLTEMGYQYTIDQAKIPTAFAAQISNTTMQGVNTIMADSNLSSTNDGWIDSKGLYVAGTGTPPAGATPSSPKTRAVQNVINYANAQISWASKFYGTTVPPISATSSSAATVPAPTTPSRATSP